MLRTGSEAEVPTSDVDIDHVAVQMLATLVERQVQLENGVVSLVDEVVRLRQTVAALETRQASDAPALAALQIRQSRNLSHAADLMAAASSAEYAQTHFPTAITCPNARATLHHGLGLVSVPGMALEFGVASGSSLRVVAATLRDHPVFGFDVFSGLPEDWRTGYAAGAFAQEPPVVPGAQIVAGLFADTLPGFLAGNPEPVAFAHIDCDLYSSTVTVLEHIGLRLRAGSVIVFDEYFNYPGWQQHEHKAWQEFVQRTGVTFTYEAYTVDHEQLVVKIVEPVAR